MRNIRKSTWWDLTLLFCLFQSMSDTRPKLCGRKLELWSWLCGALDDYCAERCACLCVIPCNHSGVIFHYCYMFCSARLSLGGCRAVLSQVPAAGPWSSAICCGQRKPWQGAGLFKEVLHWEGLCGSEGFKTRDFIDTQGRMWGYPIKPISCFYVFLTEKFLRPSRAVDVSLHVSACWSVEEPLAGLPEGL